MLLHSRIIFYCFCFVSFVYPLQAQVNLVPNFGFEEYIACPTTWDEVHLATGWSKYCPASYTPDYYNACASSNTVGIPQSLLVYQEDRRGCGGYMAVATWSQTVVNERELIGIQLSQPLIIGQKYFLSFYTVRGGFSDDSDCPSNNIGMRLSTVAYSPSNPAPIDNFSHLRSVSIISDTAIWVRISGSIVADAAYQYLIMGNFYDDSNTDTLTQTCGTCTNYGSYYLIDDVCVSTDSTLCNGGIDALPCVVSVEENSFNNQFSFFPNPANEFVVITNNSNAPFDVEIYNSIGQLFYTEQNVNTNNLKMDINSFNNGLLFIRITSQNNQLMYKLLKQ
jgi:hypothetical protein